MIQLKVYIQGNFPLHRNSCPVLLPSIYNSLLISDHNLRRNLLLSYFHDCNLGKSFSCYLSSSPLCHFVDLSIFNFLHIINLQGIALPEFNERKQFTMKTKRFKNLCPHTNSEMEISVLYQEVPMTGTLTKHFKKSDFICPKLSACPYGQKKCPVFLSAPTSL